MCYYFHFIFKKRERETERLRVSAHGHTKKKWRRQNVRTEFTAGKFYRAGVLTTTPMLSVVDEGDFKTYAR